MLQDNSERNNTLSDGSVVELKWTGKDWKVLEGAEKHEKDIFKKA